MAFSLESCIGTSSIRHNLVIREGWIRTLVQRPDSCHSRCIGINKIYILNPTSVAKLLQYSSSRVEHRDEFSSYK